MGTKIYPTVNQTIEYMNRADTDEPKYRNTTDLMQLLKKISYFSPKIAGHILTRRTGIMSYDWTIEGEDPERAKDIKQRLNYFINQYVLKYYINSPLYGIFGLNYKFENVGGVNVPKLIKLYDPIELDYQNDKLLIIDNSIRKEVTDPQNWLYHIHNQSYRGGILRTVVLYEIMRNESIQEWLSLNKRLKGILAGLLDASKMQNTAAMMGLSDADIASSVNKIDNSLQYVEQHNWLRTYDFADIKAFKVAEAESGQSLSNFITMIDNSIAIAILGQANTAELPNNSGSRAALQVLNLIRNDIIYSDLLAVEEICNSLLLQYEKVNFNPAIDSNNYNFKFVFDEVEDVEANTRNLETLSRIPNLQLKTDEVYRKTGYTRPDEVDNDIISFKQNEGVF